MESRGNLTVIQTHPRERTKREVSLSRSVEDLVNVMQELILVEKQTGRTGLPQRVFLAFSDTLGAAMHIADERKC